MQATHSAHVILSDIIVRIIFGEEYKIRSSSLYCFLQPPIIPSLSDANILFSTEFQKYF
jgi:hypothetical protein